MFRTGKALDPPRDAAVPSEMVEAVLSNEGQSERYLGLER